MLQSVVILAVELTAAEAKTIIHQTALPQLNSTVKTN